MGFSPSYLLKSYFLSFVGLPRASWHGIYLSFVESALGGVCFFLSLYFVDILHINIAATGVIISAYGVGRVVGGIVGGKLVDKFSAQKTSVWSLFLQGVTYLALIKIKSIFGLTIILFLLGAEAYAFMTSNNVWVLEQCSNSETEKLKSINLIYTSSNLGMGIAALITAIFASHSFIWVFWISGILLIFQSILLALENPPKGTTTQILDLRDQKTEVSKNKNSAVIFVMLSCLFLISLVVVQRNTTYLVYIHETFTHLGYSGTSILFALNPILIVLFQTPLVTSFGKFNKILMVGVSTFLMGFGTLLLVFTGTFAIPILSCVIYTIGEMIFFSMVQFVIYQHIDKKKKGMGFGLYKTVYGLSTVIGPILGGGIYHQFGANMVWYLSGLIGLICLIACIYHQQHD